MSTYKYAPLQAGDIRVFVLSSGTTGHPLSGSLDVTRLDPEPEASNPHFEAISYVWGDQVDPEFINVRDESTGSHERIAVGRNLADALRAVRHERDRKTLWTDQVCINQQDLDERAAQVRLMGDIFAHAQRVIAWLGPGDHDSRVAIQAFRDIAANVDFRNYEHDLMTNNLRLWTGTDECYADPNKDLPLSKEQWEAVENFITQRSWFRRLWIRQEIALASADTIMIVGDDSLLWTHFSAALELISSKRYGPSIRPFDLSVDLFTARTFLYMRHQRDFASLVAFTHHCEATDPRDLVYGLLGVASGPLTETIPIDYTRPIKTVYRDALSAASYWHQNTMFLSFCDNATAPTWIPDLDRVRHLRPIAYGRAGMATAIRAQNLSYSHAEAHGIRCDKISEVLGPTTEKEQSTKNLQAVVVTAAVRYLGPDPEIWTQEKVAKFCLALLVNNAEFYHPHLDIPVAHLKRWVTAYKDEPDDIPFENEDDETVHVLPWTYYLRGRCLYMTESGCIALGPRKCRPGDIVCVFLGSNLPIVLHAADSGDGTWQIRGPVCHPELYEGEALMGKLPPGWNTRHINRSNKPVFQGPDGSQHHIDPRLDDVPVPSEWELRWTDDGTPFWFHAEEDRWTDFDPRLTMEEIQKRGVEVELFTMT